MSFLFSIIANYYCSDHTEDDMGGHVANMIRRIYAYTCVEDGFWIRNSTCMDRIHLAQYREPAESSSEYSYGCRFP